MMTSTAATFFWIHNKPKATILKPSAPYINKNLTKCRKYFIDRKSGSVESLIIQTDSLTTKNWNFLLVAEKMTYLSQST